MKSKLLLTFALTATALFAGCSDENMFSSAPGHFEGVVSIKKDKQRIAQSLVQADIRLDSKTQLSLKIAPLRGGAEWNFIIKAKDSKHLDLSGQALTKAKNGCFLNGADQPAARLCYDGREITIDLLNGPGGTFSLVIDRYDVNRNPVLEPAKVFPLAELLDRSMNRGFNTRAEFESVIQAKLNADHSLAMLAPHLSSSTVLAVITGGWVSLYHAVGDLIPFVFPSRWFSAKEASLQATAEYYTLLLMKADSANIVEGFAYAIERDVKTLAAFEANVLSVTHVRDQIVAKEQLGLLPLGSADDITIIINGLEAGISSLRQAINEERESLAQASGFFNPKAIIDIEIGGDLSVENPLPLDTESIMDVAKQRSYELSQMDVLIDSARWSKWEKAFSWFDLSGGEPLGLNMISFFQVAPSQIRQLTAKREGLESQLIGKATALFEEITQTLEAHGLAKQAVTIDDRRVNNALAKMDLGLNFSLPSLASALVDKAKADINQISAEYAYYIEISKVNRLVFAGPYSRLAPGSGLAATNVSAAVTSK